MRKPFITVRLTHGMLGALLEDHDLVIQGRRMGICFG